MNDHFGPERLLVDAEASQDTPYRRLVEGVDDHAVFMLDEEGVITTWPGPAEQLYGHDAESALGRTVGTLFAERSSDSRPAAELLADAKEHTVEIGRWHERADGSVFWGTLTLSPLRNARFHGYAAVCRDTTEAKEYEQMLERQNDRLKEFTDILAHDLRSPLGVIDQRVTLYEETGDEKHVQSISETTDRMARLVDDLLRVARQGGVVEDPEPTDLESVVDVAWEGTGNAAGASLHYETTSQVSADPDRLVELFENLFRNCVEHATTPATAQDGDGNLTVRVGPLANGVYVADDGPGVPESLGSSVFDHGITTADDGSGYGLSIVRTIVNAHGWDIAVTEADAGGACFEITGIEFL